MKSNIFNQIMKYIDEHDILYNYDTYEQMPVFHVLSELDCLSNYIKKDYYTSFCVNMAFIIYFDLCINKDAEGGYITVDVVYTRKADKHTKMFHTPIDIKETKVYEHVKNTIGINDFSCFYYKNEYQEEYYSFVPKAEI